MNAIKKAEKKYDGLTEFYKQKLDKYIDKYGVRELGRIIGKSHSTIIAAKNRNNLTGFKKIVSLIKEKVGEKK